MKKLDRIVDRACQVLIRIAGVFLLAMMVFVFVNIILRLVFKSPIFGSTEIVRYLALVGGALALAQNEWYDGNIRVTMVLEFIPKKAAEFITFISYLAMSAGISYIVYNLVQQAIKYFNSSMTTSELKMPTYIFSAILAFGFATLALIFICKTIIWGYKAFSKQDTGKMGIHKAPLE